MPAHLNTRTGDNARTARAGAYSGDRAFPARVYGQDSGKGCVGVRVLVYGVYVCVRMGSCDTDGGVGDSMGEIVGDWG